MSDGYRGLGPEDRNGCLMAAIVGLLAFIFLDFARIYGDPARTEDAWWRQVPFFVPTLIAVTATFLFVRFVSSRDNSDGI